MATYGNVVTQYYKQREAAAGAGAAQVRFTSFALGDGNGTVPALSNTGTGLVNRIYGPVSVGTVGVNPSNPYQIDIQCPLPFLDGSNNPIGPFAVREVAVYDELGRQVVAGITNFEKTTAAQGQDSSFDYIVSIVIGDTNAVIISTPTGSFATTDDILSIDANMADLLALIAFNARRRRALDDHVRRGDERTFALQQRLKAAGL